jgi:hypothetical protein
MVCTMRHDENVSGLLNDHVRGGATVTADGVGHIVHLRIDASDEAAAMVFAYRLAAGLAHLGDVDLVSTTLSAEDLQNRRRWVFCGRRLGVAQRCLLPDGHPGGHSARHLGV